MEFAKRAYRGLRPYIPALVDETLQMWRHLGYFPNIRRPRTLNEKIANRKLLDYNPRFAILADKWSVRNFVRSRIGEEYLNPVYQYVKSTRDVDLDILPRSFVMKATHDSGSTYIVEEKADQDWEQTFHELEQRLGALYGVETHQYWYAEISPGLIIEERIRDERYGTPLDFKIFTFHGRSRVIQVIHPELEGRPQRFYDRDWTALDVRRPNVPMAPVIEQPKQLAHMLKLADVLGQDLDFVRVDLYAPNDERVVFGELTFAPASGRRSFIPSAFDRQLGAFW